MSTHICLDSIRIEILENTNRLVFDYTIGDHGDQIFFEVEKKYGEYLCYERADAFVICFIPYAMIHNCNIESRIPITEDLLYNLRMYLIPTIVKYNPELFIPKLDAPVATEIIQNHKKKGGGDKLFWWS